MLCDTGHADTAYDLLFRRTAPSWLYMPDRGATTIWEDWEVAPVPQATAPPRPPRQAGSVPPAV
ncbi:hypothetical protein [Streptomyces sp. NPDC097640]|uniref:alpha-L-rhamnosidase-related protein n=1 Tax=Streptomyces sp. NPDC097640 TaxID=3157229 RepID=UPI00332C3D2C